LLRGKPWKPVVVDFILLPYWIRGQICTSGGPHLGFSKEALCWRLSQNQAASDEKVGSGSYCPSNRSVGVQLFMLVWGYLRYQVNSLRKDAEFCPLVGVLLESKAL
jgi:hypothetical protein